MTQYNCRFCKTELKNEFIDLGTSPLANSFLKKQELESDEKKFPLKVLVCNNCLLVQLPEFESPEKIFSNYAYFSSFSKSWLEHCKKFTDIITQKNKLDEKSLVVEIASNDGYLLQFFKEKKIDVLGIEPAANVAKIAEEKGIKTLVEFFGENIANKISSEGTKADLIIANNVLAHVPDINDFIKGMKILLKQNGTISVEFPHLLQLIQNNQFDTIYHEHFSYYSLFTVKKIFENFNLEIFNVEEVSTHGGSLRIYVKHKENNLKNISESVNVILEKEKKFGILNLTTYQDFSGKIKSLKNQIKVFFENAKKDKKKVVCYGAAAKGNTLLNYCEIGKDAIEYTVDKSPHKQGLYLPGSHIPIHEPERIKDTKPDFVVILPWNIKNEIINEISYVRDWGGKFVILVPEVKIE